MVFACTRGARFSHAPRRLIVLIGLALSLAGPTAIEPQGVYADDANEGGFRFSDAEGRLSVFEGKRPVLVYNYGVQHKAGVPEDRARACYVHPLYGLEGEVLTDDFPVDHYHHRGLFWAWPHVRLGGQEYDLWMLHGIRQQFERWTEQTAAPEAAVLAFENGWYVEDRRVLREQIRLHILPASDHERAIDIELKLAAEMEPVVLWGAQDKSYGGLSLRFAPREETIIVTEAGRQTEDLNLARMAWAELSGKFAGASQASGVAIFTTPEHPGFPPTWITRHYGFLGVGWPGVEPVTLAPKEPIVLKYHLLVHRGARNTAEPHSGAPRLPDEGSTR